MSVMISYAQNREDVYLNWLLNGQPEGRYVDIGANDPVVHSVTKFFYDLGWSGLNIEPIKRHAADLRKSRPHDITLQIGISDHPGKEKFREYVDAAGLSSFSAAMKSEYGQDVKFREYEVEVKTLAAVLDEQGFEAIDFLKVDVEGYEYEALNSNDWQRFRPRVVVAEVNHISQDWRPLLQRQGYEMIFFDGLNEYFTCDQSIAERHRQTFSRFVIAPTILDQRTVEHMKWHEGQAMTQLQQRLAEQGRELAAAHDHLRYLEGWLNQPIRVRARVLLRDALVAVKVRLAYRLGVNMVNPMYQKSAELSAAVSQSDPDHVQLLAAVKAADLHNYLRPPRRRRFGPFVYNVLRQGYRSLRAMWRKARRAMGGGRG